MAITSEDELRQLGFDVRLSEPPACHYDVVVGAEYITADVETLVTHFEARRWVDPCGN